MAIGAINNRVIIKLLYFLEKIIYKNSSFIVPLSVDMKESIVSRYPQFKDKIPYVIENISEVNRFNKTDGDINVESLIGFKPRFTVLYAGTFGKVNGIEYIVRMAHKLRSFDTSIVFLLLGDGNEKEYILKLAKDLKVFNKNVFIKDPISKTELSTLYASVDMGSSFVIPIKELWANSANKFFDTIAASRPILINHGGWQKKVIEKYNIGYVLPVNINDLNPLKFVEYTRNQKLQTQQQINAFDKAKKSYSLEIAVDKYLNIFEMVKN